MCESDQQQPDRPAVTLETRQLRAATRALRLHLDKLPIDLQLDVTGDRFLAGIAFMGARHRYSCAESMLGAGFGGTVIGAMSRSLFIDGLRWLWIGEQPDRRRALLGELRDERNGLLIRLERGGASLANQSRWLMPIPDVADLAGRSMSWLDAPSPPTDDELLDHFLARRNGPQPAPGGSEHQQLLYELRVLLDMSGLHGAVSVLKHAGHGNYLGLMGSLTIDGAVGHDLRADHEALFMQVAAVGATATLIGGAAAMPETWPSDVPRHPYIERAVELAAAVAEAAAPIHKLDTARRPVPQTKKRTTPPRRNPLLRPDVVQSADPWSLDPDVIRTLNGTVEDFYESVRSQAFRAWDYGQPTLHSMLAYGGGHSTLQTVMTAYNQPGVEIVAVFAARMLLEEAARMVWRFSVADVDAFKARAKQYFDEFRARQRRTISTLTSSGVPLADAARIFERPKNVRIVTSDDDIAKGRKPIPPIETLLQEMGAPFPEPGWLNLGYSLLSQITHNTPIGQLHTIQYRDGTWHGHELSPEMLGLALDVACLGSAHLIGLSARLITDSADDAVQYHDELLGRAAVVHSAARFVHGLD